MSKVLDVVEPTVISHELLQASLDEALQQAGESAVEEFKRRNLALTDAETISLSFKNILHIENLEGFRNLRKLQLDNNIIEEIKNLGHLVNLTWLDLSFNNITKIEGLENLVNLTDLTLYSNKIENIANLDNNKKLQVLSLGQNRIASLEQLMYLRSFKSLRVLNLEGNPICKEPDYKLYVLAHLKALKYLDYALIEEASVVAAREAHQDELLGLEEEEQTKEQAAMAKKVHDEAVKLLSAAHIQCTDSLFVNLFEGDQEVNKLKHLPGFQELVDDYKEKCRDLIKAFQATMLEKNQSRLSGVEAFERAVHKSEQENEKESVKLIEKFNSQKKRILRMDQYDREREKQLAQLLDEVDELKDTLIALEMNLSERLEDAMVEFEISTSEIVKFMLEHSSDFFKSVEELENQYGQWVIQKAQAQLELFNQNQTAEDFPEELVHLLSEKETLMNACNQSHEIHVGKILAMDDEVKEGLTQEKDTFFKKMRERQYHRNRDRIWEIHHFSQQVKSEITQKLSMTNRSDD
eukprot:GILI01007203.1.p1 GENE.GILI01007203.1~~GILI01007203.1.p1  ORF type:complete len:523 (+),score=182.97 GILI01007203.1:70-1638(+)